MNSSPVQRQTRSEAEVKTTWDLDSMVDHVWRSLHQKVDQQTIRSKLLNILIKYEDVRVQNFVPIFACRETIEALLANLTASDEKQSEWVML